MPFILLAMSPSKEGSMSLMACVMVRLTWGSVTNRTGSKMSNLFWTRGFRGREVWHPGDVRVGGSGVAPWWCNVGVGVWHPGGVRCGG